MTPQDETFFTEEIVSFGLKEISKIKTKYANLYYEREDLRFLISIPPEGGAQHFYLFDLAQCLHYTGLNVHIYQDSAGDLEKVLSDFHPTVFLIGEPSPMAYNKKAVSESASLNNFKSKYGLARLYIPFYKSPLRISKAITSESDRISLHRDGRLADAFFGYFEDVFWDVFCEHLKETGLNYFSVPFAANPFRHYPVLTAKKFDWGIATANSDLGVRAALTRRYMSRIMGKYQGSLAGYLWGKGIDPVPPTQISEFFSHARIAPNFAAESNIHYPLDCGAKVHELSAMGVFQLTNETVALRKYYSKKEIVGVHNPEEFYALFDYFVNKPDVRQMFIMNSMARTFTENTYFQRIVKFIEILDKHPELFGK